MEINDSDRKALLFGLFIALIIIVIGVVLSYIIINFKYNRTEYIINDYVYKIRYDVENESYIFLVDDNVIKTLVASNYDKCQNDKCYVIKNKYYYKERTINFSLDKMEKALNVIKSLASRSGKKEFNAKKLKLSSEEEKILRAIILNDESLIK